MHLLSTEINIFIFTATNSQTCLFSMQKVLAYVGLTLKLQLLFLNLLFVGPPMLGLNLKIKLTCTRNTDIAPHKFYMHQMKPQISCEELVNYQFDDMPVWFHVDIGLSNVQFPVKNCEESKHKFL